MGSFQSAFRTAFTVLVIDEQAESRDHVCRALTHMQIRSVSATTVADVLREFEACPFTMAIIGYNVEGGGLPLAGRLSGLAAAAQQPLVVVIIADKIGAALEAAALKVQAVGVLARPVDVKALARFVEAHVMAITAADQEAKAPGSPL